MRVTVSPCTSYDLEERTTRGWVVSLYAGRLVLELWLTRR